VSFLLILPIPDSFFFFFYLSGGSKVDMCGVIVEELPNITAGEGHVGCPVLSSWIQGNDSLLSSRFFLPLPFPFFSPLFLFLT